MTAFKIAYSCCFSLKNLDFLQKKFLTSTTAQTCGEYQQLGPILRLVQTYCVKRISLGCFLRMQKTQPIRKFSILLCKRMRFYAGLNKPLIGFFIPGNPSVGAAVKKSLWRHLFREIPPPLISYSISMSKIMFSRQKSYCDIGIHRHRLQQIQQRVLRCTFNTRSSVLPTNIFSA